eukprot:s1349_g11.t1
MAPTVAPAQNPLPLPTPKGPALTPLPAGPVSPKSAMASEKQKATNKADRRPKRKQRTLATSRRSLVAKSRAGWVASIRTRRTFKDKMCMRRRLDGPEIEIEDSVPSTDDLDRR